MPRLLRPLLHTAYVPPNTSTLIRFSLGVFPASASTSPSLVVALDMISQTGDAGIPESNGHLIDRE